MSARVAADYCTTADLMTARKPHRCSEGRVRCSRRIHPGDLYVSHVIFPGHDVIEVARPTRIAECVECWTTRTGSLALAAPGEPGKEGAS